LAARLGLRERLGRFPRYYERALAIGRTLVEVPGISIKPNPPQTNMLHVYLRGDRDRLLAAAVEIARTERVALFGGLRPTDVPDVSWFELAIGDAAEVLNDQEIGDLFQRVMLAGG
ncbi:MAG TPA: hypothetical protein VGN32_19705, partial [Ktedonobacterales bacterium]|nr:hypothetical protein [Ktedonobacterales bacterium]